MKENIKQEILNVRKELFDMKQNILHPEWIHKVGLMIDELDILVSRVELPVKPACDEQILQAKIDELENWIKYLNWNPTNIIHKSMLMDRIKILENENRKSV